MSRRARLKPDEVRCDECQQPLLKLAAAGINGLQLHPEPCFGKALAKWRKTVDELLVKNVGSIKLSISVDSASPRVAAQLDALASNVMLARRAAR